MSQYSVPTDIPCKLRLTGISKVFETELLETHALKNINLEIYEGQYVSISGPSGCGKSTLLSILGLLDEPSGGKYEIEGLNVTRLTSNKAAEIRNDKIGFVFQSFNLIDEMTVEENIALPLRYRSTPLAEDAISQRVDECLEMVDMSHRKLHHPNQLSGGQQQRIAIARALVSNPAILLVDEPTGNLDSKSGDVVMDMLARLNEQGTTICMVTHDPRYANMATTRLQLLDGVLTEEKFELRKAQ